MEVTEDVSWWKVGVRSMIAIIVLGGLLIQQLHIALAVAALSYVVTEGARLQALAQRHDKPALKTVMTSGVVL